MFFGGWLYPDAPSVADAGVAAAFNELGLNGLTFNKDEFDCAAMGTEVEQATSAPTKRKCKAFRTGISSPASIHRKKPGEKSYFG
jgi:hypothetical protein